MATGTAAAGNGALNVATVGSGQGVGVLTLCSITLGAAERAGRVRALAWSDTGERVAADGICAVVPDDGISPTAGDLLFVGHATLSVNAGHLEFQIPAGVGETWYGWLEVDLTYDYAV